MKMYDMGVMQKQMGMVPGEETGKKEKSYPSVTLSGNEAEALMDFDVNEDISLHIMGKVVRKEINETNENKRKEIGVEIKQCGIMNEKDSRKNADRLGLDKAEYDKIQAERKSKTSK